MRVIKPKNTNNYFLDANIFIRFLRQDGPIDQQHVSLRVFNALQEKIITGSIHTLVVSEILYVLIGVYKVKKRAAVKALISLLSLDTIEVVDVEKPVLIAAMQQYGMRSVDFQDCFYAALVANQGLALISFDQDFKKLGVESRTAF